MMKKIIFSLLLLFGTLLFLGFGEVQATDPTFDLNIKINLGDNELDDLLIKDVTYGQGINLDTGSYDYEGYEFLGYIIEGKVNQSIINSQLFRVTENTDLMYYFKPVDSTAVIFMDSNHDFVDVLYTDEDGKITGVPDYTVFSKPGLTPIGWNVNDISNHVFTKDTIVYLKYQNNSDNKTLTFDSGSGLETVDKEYNSIVTLTADGAGDFSYWLKDGRIASLNETYTFTMVDEHTVEAVYNDEDFVEDSDTLVYISDKLELRTGYDTIVGQIHLGDDEELIEWGIIASDMEGGITFDTPDVKVAKSSGYNSISKEFMMSFDQDTYSFTNHRGFAKVINTETEEVKTVYSYYQVEDEPTYATDLIISEYGEGSGYNKWIEIYNGTGANIDLSKYIIELYTNGSDSASSTVTLTGTITHNSTYTIMHTSADANAKNLANLIHDGVTNFNGDDAIALFKGENLIDKFGQIGHDPGSSWSSGGVVTVDKTLIRKSTVLSGYTADESFYPSLEWISNPKDYFGNIGSHTMDLIPGKNIILTKDNTARSLTIEGLTSVNVNETIALSSDVEDVIWISSNPAILTVDANGLVSGVAEGSANVTAYNLYDHSVMNSVTIEVLALQNYDVTFNNEGVTSLVTVEGGTLVEEPISPTISGYVFGGWFVNLTDEFAYDFSTPVQSDLTLHAKWVEISTIQDFRTNHTGDYIKGIVTGKNGGFIFINDSTAAIAYYDTADVIVNSISIGDEVLFGGLTHTTLNGLVRFSYETYEKLSSGNTLPEALSITSLSEITEELQSQRVSISGLTVSSFDGVNLFVSDGTNTIMIWSMTQTAVRQLIETAVDNQTINLVNIHVGWYDNPEFTALNVEEIQLIELSDIMKVNEIKTELTALYSGKSYASGGTIDLIATSVRFGGTISWATSNEVMDLSDGSIGSLESDTTVTLTASIAVNGLADSITLEITVLGSESPTNTTYIENFNTSTLSASYSDGSISGINGQIWNYIHSRNQETYAIDGNGLMLRYGDSSLSTTFSGGVSEFSIQFRKAFTGASPRQIIVTLIDENNNTEELLSDTFGNTSGASDTVYTLSRSNLNLIGEVQVLIKLNFKGTTNKQTVVDNIQWTTNVNPK